MRGSRHLVFRLRIIAALIVLVGTLLACSANDNGGGGGGGGTVTLTQIPLFATGVRTYLSEVFGGHQSGSCTQAVPSRDGLTNAANDEVIVGHDHWVDGEPGCDDFAAYVYRGLVLFDLRQVISQLASEGVSQSGVVSARLHFSVLSSTDDLGTALPDCAASLELATSQWPGPYSAASNATPTPSTSANAALPGPVILLASMQEFPKGVTIGPNHEYTLPAPVPSADVTTGAIQVASDGGQPPLRRFNIDVLDWVKSWVGNDTPTTGSTANNGFMFTSVNESLDGSWTSRSFCRTHLGNFRLDVSTV